MAKNFNFIKSLEVSTILPLKVLHRAEFGRTESTKHDFLLMFKWISCL